MVFLCVHRVKCITTVQETMQSTLATTTAKRKVVGASVGRNAFV